MPLAQDCYRTWKVAARVEPVRHRQTKGAATDMFGLQPLRHTPTLPRRAIPNAKVEWPGGSEFAIWQVLRLTLSAPNGKEREHVRLNNRVNDRRVGQRARWTILRRGP